MIRFVNRAVKISEESDHQHFQMGCVVFKGGRLLAEAANYKWNHAEPRALRKHMDFEGATLVIMRRNGGTSKPCSKCMEKIIDAKIKRIVYVNHEGRLAKDRVYT